MTIEHYEAGQKTDVQFASDKSNLLPIKAKEVSSTFAYHTYNVPSRKRWIIRAVHMNRVEAGTMQLTIRDLTGTEQIIAEETAANLFLFLPAQRLAVPTGWDVRLKHITAVSGWCYSKLLIEEEDEY